MLIMCRAPKFISAPCTFYPLGEKQGSGHLSQAFPPICTRLLHNLYDPVDFQELSHFRGRRHLQTKTESKSLLRIHAGLVVICYNLLPC